MKRLTEELKVINASINFATGRGLDYSIYRCPTLFGNPKRLEIIFGRGNPYGPCFQDFGVSCGLTAQGEVSFHQLHIFPLNQDYKEETKQFRHYLKRKFKHLEVKY